MSNIHQQIELYLEGQLTGKELETFEKELKTNKELAAELNLYKEIQINLKSKFQNESDKISTEKTLSTLGGKYFKEEIKKQHTPRQSANQKTIFMWLGIAATILFLLCSFPWKTSLYKRYAIHPSLQLTARGDLNSINVKDMEVAFNTKKYAQAQSLFESYLATDTTSLQIKFYNGIIALELDQFDTANKTLMPIYQGNSAYKSEATWYLALLHLKQNQLDVCKDYLVKIPIESDRYNQAQSLLKEF